MKSKTYQAPVLSIDVIEIEKGIAQSISAEQSIINDMMYEEW